MAPGSVALKVKLALEEATVPDGHVNVLVYAHREDASDHTAYRDWLGTTLASEAAYGISDLVLSGFIRVVTHPRVFAKPSPMRLALAFADAVRGRPNCVPIAPGRRHWPIFARLCRTAGVKGNLGPRPVPRRSRHRVPERMDHDRS